MKNELRLIKLIDDFYSEELVRMHQEILIDTELYGRMIYFDDAFTGYLKQILKSEDHCIFGVLVNNIIKGFAHFRIFPETVFLNNIYLDKDIRGKGAGKNFLYKALTEFETPKCLELDVLRSNIQVKNWYKSLGLEDVEVSDWCHAEINREQRDTLGFEIALDVNNFKSIFLNGIKVATIINDESIIAHDEVALHYQTDMKFIFKAADNQELSRDVNLWKFDSSIRMSGSIASILKTLECSNLR